MAIFVGIVGLVLMLAGALSLTARDRSKPSGARRLTSVVLVAAGVACLIVGFTVL